VRNLIVKFKNGESYSIPASVIIEPTVQRWAKRDDDTSPEHIAELTASFDDYDVIDQALGNFFWRELAPHATLIANPPPPPFNYEKGFMNAKLEVVDDV